MTEFHRLTPFKRCVLQNFPFIEEDFDALTNYALLCKVVEYLNKVIKSQNDLGAEVENFEETINISFQDLLSRFNNLKDYVDNYFDNLDVQEEINNKLDEMTESGQIADIIAAYIELRGILAYDTVAAMKSADNLVNGSFAETYGFYAKGDGGSAKYKVREITNIDVVDEMTLFALTDENLVAELILQPEMNVRQFGAKGDGVTDDTDNIQKSLEIGVAIDFDNSVYMTTGLSCKNDNVLNFDNTTIKMITNDLTAYTVLLLDEVDNVKLQGSVNIVGDKATHTGVTGEWGTCVRIRGCHNITIDTLHCEYGWGDGLAISLSTDHSKNSKNIIINNLVCNNNRRNGLTIGSGEDVIINNLITHDNYGTAPNGGFDIETSNDSDNVKVSIGTVYAYNNGVSPQYYQAFISNLYTDNFNVNIDNLVCEGVFNMNVRKNTSSVTINKLELTTAATSTEGIILTNKGRCNIGELILDCTLSSNFTSKPIIYSDYLYDCFIDKLFITNTDDQTNYLINNNVEVKKLVIGYLDYNGNTQQYNTQNTNIMLSNVSKKELNIDENSDSTAILPFNNVISVSGEVTSVSYNDIMKYDNNVLFVKNNNTTATVRFNLNIRKFLKQDGTLAGYIDIQPNKVAKVRYDATSNLYVVEYLAPLS